MKTAISDMLMVKTVKPISFAPFSAAANGSIPSSIWRVMFSITTMASSTTNPVEMVKRHQRKVVETVAAEIHHRKGADERDRNRNRWNQRGARAAQEDEDDDDDQYDREISVRSTSFTDARIVVVRLRTIVVSMPLGIEASTEGSAA